MMPTDPRLVPLVEQLQTLLERVRQLPPGGDLEGLIEEGLSQLEPALYQALLQARQQQASQHTDAFSPSALSSRPRADAS